MSGNAPDFITYDSETKEQELVALFENLTEKTLYPAQDERIMISLIEYKAALLVEAFNEAARLNLPQFSRDTFLDCIGEAMDTPRLQGECGQDTSQVELNEAFTSNLTIPKGLEVLSKDETYSFKTTDDLVITAGETTGTVQIEATEIGEAVNVYGAGDVNILVRPVSYIKSVTNLNGISGGTDIEDDTSYTKRILLAPEKFSCAGSRKAYTYHTLSANTSIIDAQAESPQLPAIIKKSVTTTTITGEGDHAVTKTSTASKEFTASDNGTITGYNFTATVDYKTGKITFSDTPGVSYEMTIPPQATVYIYPLTAEDTTPQSVLDDVDNKLNGEEINPMTDFVQVVAPTKKTKAITVNVVIDSSVDYNITSGLINGVTTAYTSEMRRKLNGAIIPSQIVAKIGAINGVYSVDCGNLTSETAKINEFYAITMTVNITQRGAI